MFQNNEYTYIFKKLTLIAYMFSKELTFMHVFKLIHVYERVQENDFKISGFAFQILGTVTFGKTK